MAPELSARQTLERDGFREFARGRIAPHAGSFDIAECLPAAVVEELVARGYLGAVIAAESGGRGMDMVTFGLLNEELGWACSSVRSLLTVHSMVSHAIQRWGNQSQRTRWLGALASGQVIGAFCLSEPDAGSDATAVTTTARRHGETYVLQGRKSWVSFGQIAGCFLVLARCDTGSVALLVERETPGLVIVPRRGLHGTRAAMLADLHFDECVVPRANLLGGPGFGLGAIGASALDLGRYSVAWGCVGIAQACLDASVGFTRHRRQFGHALQEHALVQRLLTDMITSVRAARLLCLSAGTARDRAAATAVADTTIAKYFASTAAARIASAAVQLHGARGCTGEYPVERHLRDSKVMEIIEGSTQIQEIAIAREYCAAAGQGDGNV